MKRTAIDCLRRAALSIRANFGLVWLRLLQELLFAVLFVASLVPPLVVLGGAALFEGEWSEAALEGWIAGLGDQLAGVALPLTLAVLASLVIGLLVVMVWGWFEGGVLGVLVAAERQAVPGAEDRAGGWRWFRTFSLRDFSGWGGRYLWRFFWFFHLAFTVLLVLLLLMLLLVLGAVYGGESWGPGAAFGIGCGGALPLVFLFLVYALWFNVAQPAVALEESGAVRGSSLGLRIVGRRLGASLLILLVAIVAAVGVGLFFSIGQWTAALFAQDSFTALITIYLVFGLLQMVVGAVVNLYVLAAYTSLVVAEAGGAPR